MIRIITDSAIDITPRLKERIRQVPLTVSFGDQEYLDGVDLSKDEFYTRLSDSELLPVTSQAPPARFMEVFEEVEKAGDSAVVLTVSSKLSGTYQSACIAAAEFDNIRVVDTLNVAMGGGILAEYAQQLADQGMGLDEIAQAVEKKKEDVCLVAMLDTLKYLEKGGRISKLAAFAGGMLNVKPAIAVEEGTVAVLGKVRGSKNANNYLIKKVSEVGVDYNMPVLLAYSGVSDSLLQKYIDDSKQLWENKVEPLESVQICTVVGTHVGPGAVGVAFFRA
ncbi:MAG: DegV family protein [Lachnospiraceae bacterium]|nr:DegV family protein [Lachnospiraceae bacterium]